MVGILKENGYSTIAIHPYQKTFYSRNMAYNKLGFNKFVTEESFVDVTRPRAYIYIRFR